MCNVEFSFIGLVFDTKTLNVHIDKSKRQKSGTDLHLFAFYAVNSNDQCRCSILHDSGIQSQAFQGTFKQWRKVCFLLYIDKIISY